MRPSAQRCLDIQVSENSINRAAATMDALLEALNDRGIKYSYSEQNHAFLIALHGEEFRFYIKEKVKRKEVPPTPEQKRKMRSSEYYWYSKEYTYHPTGVLTLGFANSSNYKLREFNDGKIQRIETLLNKFIVGLYEYIAGARAARIQSEEMQKRHEEQLQREWEARRKAEEERKRVEALFQDAENWRKSENLREYIRAVQEKFNMQDLTEDQIKTLTDWVKWASTQADHLDPLYRVVI